MAFFLPLPLLLWFSSVIVAQQLCNGNAAYCDRIYSNVSEIGAHDSAFVGALPQDNQDVSVTAQLNAGIRLYVPGQVPIATTQLTRYNQSTRTNTQGPFRNIISVPYHML